MLDLLEHVKLDVDLKMLAHFGLTKKDFPEIHLGKISTDFNDKHETWIAQNLMTSIFISERIVTWKREHQDYSCREQTPFCNLKSWLFLKLELG